MTNRSGTSNVAPIPQHSITRSIVLHLGRILAFTPLYYAVWWKKNIYLGMILFRAVNLVGGVMILTLVLD